MTNVDLARQREDEWNREFWAQVDQDLGDRNIPGMEVMTGEIRYKRLPDGRWYVWLSGAKQWGLYHESMELEMAYQAGIRGRKC